MTHAAITAIYRYPVKGLSPQWLSRAALAAHMEPATGLWVTLPAGC